jgi:hypothetical protein
MIREKENPAKMFPLREYYEALPDFNRPKTDFVVELARHCGVSDVAVRSWIKGVRRPIRKEHREYIAARIGAKPEDLWNDRETE